MGFKLAYFLSTSISIILTLISPGFADCFNVDGEINLNDVPCGPGLYSSCCGHDWTCQSGGVCKAPDGERWARGSCTDSHWMSSVCPQFCLSVTARSLDIIKCSSDAWCCVVAVEDGKSCCAKSENLFYLEEGYIVKGRLPLAITSQQPKPPPATLNTVTAPLASKPTPTSLVPYTSRRSTSSTTTSASAKVPSDTTQTPLSISAITRSIGNSSSTSISQRPEATGMSNTTSSTNSAPTETPPKTTNNDELIAGIAVPFSCILLAASAFYLRHRRRKQKSQPHEQSQHEEKIQNWYTIPIRRGPHELDTRLISRPYIKPELSSDEARRDVVEVEADEVVRGLRSVRASVVEGGRGEGGGGEGEGEGG